MYRDYGQVLDTGMSYKSQFENVRSSASSVSRSSTIPSLINMNTAGRTMEQPSSYDAQYSKVGQRSTNQQGFDVSSSSRQSLQDRYMSGDRGVSRMSTAQSVSRFGSSYDDRTGLREERRGLLDYGSSRKESFTSQDYMDRQGMRPYERDSQALNKPSLLGQPSNSRSRRDSYSPSRPTDDATYRGGGGSSMFGQSLNRSDQSGSLGFSSSFTSRPEEKSMLTSFSSRFTEEIPGIGPALDSPFSSSTPSNQAHMKLGRRYMGSPCTSDEEIPRHQPLHQTSARSMDVSARGMLQGQTRMQGQRGNSTQDHQSHMEMEYARFASSIPTDHQAVQQDRRVTSLLGNPMQQNINRNTSQRDSSRSVSVRDSNHRDVSRPGLQRSSRNDFTGRSATDRTAGQRDSGRRDMGRQEARGRDRGRAGEQNNRNRSSSNNQRQNQRQDDDRRGNQRSTGSVNSGDTDADEVKKLDTKYIKKKGGIYNCDLCKIVFNCGARNAVKSIKAHLNGKKHGAALEALKKPKENKTDSKSEGKQTASSNDRNQGKNQKEKTESEKEKTEKNTPGSSTKPKSGSPSVDKEKKPATKTDKTPEKPAEKAADAQEKMDTGTVEKKDETPQDVTKSETKTPEDKKLALATALLDVLGAADEDTISSLLNKLKKGKDEKDNEEKKPEKKEGVSEEKPSSSAADVKKSDTKQKSPGPSEKKSDTSKEGQSQGKSSSVEEKKTVRQSPSRKGKDDSSQRKRPSNTDVKDLTQESPTKKANLGGKQNFGARPNSRGNANRPGTQSGPNRGGGQSGPNRPGTQSRVNRLGAQNRGGGRNQPRQGGRSGLFNTTGITSSVRGLTGITGSVRGTAGITSSIRGGMGNTGMTSMSNTMQGGSVRGMDYGPGIPGYMDERVMNRDRGGAGVIGSNWGSTTTNVSRGIMGNVGSGMNPMRSVQSSSIGMPGERRDVSRDMSGNLDRGMTSMNRMGDMGMERRMGVGIDNIMDVNRNRGMGGSAVGGMNMTDSMRGQMNMSGGINNMGGNMNNMGGGMNYMGSSAGSGVNNMGGRVNNMGMGNDNRVGSGMNEMGRGMSAGLQREMVSLDRGMGSNLQGGRMDSMQGGGMMSSNRLGTNVGDNVRPSGNIGALDYDRGIVGMRGDYGRGMNMAGVNQGGMGRDARYGGTSQGRMDDGILGPAPTSLLLPSQEVKSLLGPLPDAPRPVQRADGMGMMGNRPVSGPAVNNPSAAGVGANANRRMSGGSSGQVSKDSEAERLVKQIQRNTGIEDASVIEQAMEVCMQLDDETMEALNNLPSDLISQLTSGAVSMQSVVDRLPQQFAGTLQGGGLENNLQLVFQAVSVMGSGGEVPSLMDVSVSGRARTTPRGSKTDQSRNQERNKNRGGRRTRRR